MCEFTSFITAEVCGVGVGPWAQAAIAEITISASIVRASHTVSRILVGKWLLALRTTLKVLGCIIFSQCCLKVSPFLCSEDSDFLADCILPFKATLSSSLDLKGTLYFSLSLSDNRPNMCSYACLSDHMPTWPLICILFAEDRVLYIVDFQLCDLAECDSVLLKDQLVSNDHIKVTKFSIIRELSSFIGKPHFFWFKLLGELFKDKFLELKASRL